MKPIHASDFRARRLILDDKNFALTPGKYPGPANLIPTTS